MISNSKSRKVFQVINTVVIIAVTASCLIPLLNVLAISLSNSQAIVANEVGIWPKMFTADAYSYVMKSTKFWTSAAVSLKRVVIGVPLSILLTLLAAYPLSKPELAFPARKYYVAYLLVVMVFNGGLIPTYYVISQLNMIDTIWALTLPCAVNIFNIILVMNFFRNIPAELEESAMLDGASQWTVLTRIYLPLSKPSVATITLFCLVNHWNSWFDGLIYSNYTYNYPLQSYLQTIVTSTRDALFEGDVKAIMDMMNLNTTNIKSAQIFISMLPLLVIYPFLQKYFTAGLTLGSVKG
ncbi:carbohydrate ABC transporter permease [Lachnotalea sp. AF33-28]|uniref:carbohydrate ABC transporter permease n=1 Tax=Lachnotalea sp. AF33-28 TaxID=2292046 RepID=UPI000E4D7909|nr:carbohydrate ABC transporter permease [Lachnotalea sp. AF33-28]RHP33564.1 carbohydrate ABC transporter permease [Lachnotalea sp. AF33-28]